MKLSNCTRVIWILRYFFYNKRTIIILKYHHDKTLNNWIALEKRAIVLLCRIWNLKTIIIYIKFPLFPQMHKKGIFRNVFSKSFCELTQLCDRSHRKNRSNAWVQSFFDVSITENIYCFISDSVLIEWDSFTIIWLIVYI